MRRHPTASATKLPRRQPGHSCGRSAVGPSDPLNLRFRYEWVEHIDITAPDVIDIARDEDKAMDAGGCGKGAATN